ncbi:MAG: 23S rRNA (pseudouridine(1915)-N(3))-methyltransferase RlmH [Deltaproteobacteria bacterium]|nr:23S rRNA (pseudouridine(1915)-N(3))-methyltransferase RlmH [Deltaproteobacteria bacterium]
MKLCILTVGRGGGDWAEEAARDYGRRIARHTKLDEAHVKAERYRGDPEKVRRAEAERLLGRVSPRDRLLVLDERGADLDTRGFADLVQQARLDGVSRLVFVIGGPYGFDPSVRSRAWKVVRLSSLVLNHEVARVVLYEQVYRAFTLLAGIPYHH